MITIIYPETTDSYSMIANLNWEIHRIPYMKMPDFFTMIHDNFWLVEIRKNIFIWNHHILLNQNFEGINRWLWKHIPLWKGSLDSDGQQFHQYHQNKRKFKQWWSTIPPRYQQHEWSPLPINNWIHKRPQYMALKISILT